LLSLILSADGKKSLKNSPDLVTLNPNLSPLHDKWDEYLKSVLHTSIKVEAEILGILSKRQATALVDYEKRLRQCWPGKDPGSLWLERLEKKFDRVYIINHQLDVVAIVKSQRARTLRACTGDSRHDFLDAALDWQNYLFDFFSSYFKFIDTRPESERKSEAAARHKMENFVSLLHKLSPIDLAWSGPIIFRLDQKSRAAPVELREFLEKDASLQGPFDEYKATARLTQKYPLGH
jgi:hypothetical protein